MNSSPKKNTRNERGFTLLEILVALAVLSISLGTLIPVFSSTIQRQGIIADQKAATMLAQSKLDAVGGEVPLSDGSTDGVFENGFTWHLEITPYQSEWQSSLVTAKFVSLTVKWPAPGSPRSLTVTTIKLSGHE